MFLLIKGRHEVPFIKKFILDKVEDPTNIKQIESDVSNALDSIKEEKLDVIVTGLTSVTVALIKECYRRKLKLNLWHYDASRPVTETSTKLEDHYILQEIL